MVDCDASGAAVWGQRPTTTFIKGSCRSRSRSSPLHNVITIDDERIKRCVVHWYRNIFSHVPSTKVREIAAMLKAIYASEDIVAAREKAVRVTDKLRGLRLVKAAELAEAAVCCPIRPTAIQTNWFGNTSRPTLLAA